MTRALQWRLVGAALGLVVAYLAIAFIAWDLTWLSDMATAHPMARMAGLIMAGAIGGLGWIVGAGMLSEREHAERSDDARRQLWEGYERRQCAPDLSAIYIQRTNDTGDPGPFAQTTKETT